MVYRNRKTIRWKGYNYSHSGLYFVSFCTKDRVEYFGDIQYEKMFLNKNGEIANKLWCEIPNHHHGVEIDEFVVMPNHIHGIIIIDNENDTQCNCEESQNSNMYCNRDVGNGHARSIQDKKRPKQNNFGECRQHQLLPKIMGSYKSAESNTIHKIGLMQFQWQKSYYDRVIRNDEELNRIHEYISNNPTNWKNDRNN